ncbi:hypothetical protein [Psychrobacter sp. ANT_WB68]|uniref:hypothetical protein n=1 Tax=Psychrobacter sp. ANT_WB68 TaxID=2597355 RepID=UPI0011F32292|nr:hypothetical protein [Psychrobacter sp. ANT_WB68]KAA0915782.1 hypothetical protein FQ084_04410 [Psychrobacter sp. ANT_WB68]
MTDLIENNREFFTSYRVRFTVENPVPVNIVIDSLRAHERLIKRSGKFLESVYDGLHITATTVYVEEIVDGSWVVDFLVKYVVGEENEEQFRQLVENVLGDNEKMRTAVAVAVGALLSAGIISAYNASTPDAVAAPAIEAHNSVVIQAAGDINIPAEKVQEFIEKNKDNKQVVKDTIDALKPASVTPGSMMEVQGIPVSLTMSSEAIESLPADMSFIPPNEQDKTYDSIDIYISASDEDSGKKGWGGLVPDLFNNRVRFVLDENVDPKNLHGKRKVNASITVHEVYNANVNKYETKFVTINEVRN